MKATYHNGRASKGGKVYNANHNTLAETRNQQRHIDHELTMENKIWVSFTLHVFNEDSGDYIPTVYQAEEGMTWAEWVESPYNTNNWTLEVSDGEGESVILKQSSQLYVWIGESEDVVNTAIENGSEYTSNGP